MKKIGIFGGTFDPIHQGHLIVAEQVAQTLGFEHVIFVPGGIPPHKPASSIKASAENRFDMVEAAIQGNEKFSIDRVEIDAGEPMYSVDSVPLVKKRHEGNEWFFIAGADEVWDLHSWKEPDKLLEEVTMVAAARPGYEFSELDHLAEALENFDRIVPVECTLVNISASGIRRMLSEGKSIRYLVADEVHRIIYERGLYDAQKGTENEG
jgi:nicotinate-nucleotide adenylyltransferase